MSLADMPQYDPNSSENPFQFIIDACAKARANKAVDNYMEELRDRAKAAKVYGKRAPRSESFDGGARIRFKK